MTKPMEDLDNRELLEEIYEMVEANNEMIRGMRSRIRFQNALGIIKWVIYVGIAVGLYTYLQPFFMSIADTYKSLQGSVDTLNELGEKIPDFPFF